MVNAHWEPLEFVVQEGRPSEWQRVVDTARERPDDIREPDRVVALTSARYTVGSRSGVVLVRERMREATRFTSVCYRCYTRSR
jgi:hypothetical protein